MATGSFILDSFTFTLDSLKYAEAERAHHLRLLSAGGEGEGGEMSSLLKGQVEELARQVAELRVRVLKLEGAPAKTPPPAKEEEEIDLFASSNEEEEETDSASKLRSQRLAEYAAKKAGKPVLVAKSNVILDVKPWDDETDMAELERVVRTIEMDGLLWGASKLVPLAYGIKKLQIATVIEDERVSVDELQERIEAFEEFVQSVDIAAFNKI